MRVCLVVCFNSPFLANIPILEQIYKDRFDDIYFLMPLAEVNYANKNIITVSGKSIYFHNYFLQAYENLRGYDYYVITHDDAVLNPRFNKNDFMSRFSLPRENICIRNIDIVPRTSPWHWAWHGGYDIVDGNDQLRSLLNKLSPLMLENYYKQVSNRYPLKKDGFKYENRNIETPVLFGGGANADLLLMPGKAFDELVEKIILLNFPGLFVEIVIPMAILLTNRPIYFLNSGSHKPIFLRHSLSMPLLLALMLIRNNIACHPVKFGKSNSLKKKIFLSLYTRNVS